jgi:hypothetical protein
MSDGECDTALDLTTETRCKTTLTLSCTKPLLLARCVFA